jgi:hypothetical protein
MASISRRVYCLGDFQKEWQLYEIALRPANSLGSRQMMSRLFRKSESFFLPPGRLYPPYGNAPILFLGLFLFAFSGRARDYLLTPVFQRLQ